MQSTVEHDDYMTAVVLEGEPPANQIRNEWDLEPQGQEQQDAETLAYRDMMECCQGKNWYCGHYRGY